MMKKIYPLTIAASVLLLAARPGQKAKEPAQEANPVEQERKINALQPTPRFSRIGLEAGLPQASAYAFAQDPKGYIWVGTGDGLSRFDGYRFRVFQHESANPKSISNSAITALLDDGQGYLWIGTGEGGLNRFDHETETFIALRHDDKNPASLSSDSITSLLKDSKGNLWVGTTAGLNRIDPKSLKITVYRTEAGNVQSLSSDAVLSLAEGPSGIWIGTNAGLNRWTAEANYFTPFKHDEDVPTSLANNTVSAIYEDKLGTVWVGTDGGGLGALDPKTGRFRHFRSKPSDPDTLSDDRVRAIFEDSLGSLWVGTRGHLNKLDRKSGKFTRHISIANDPTTIPYADVVSLFEDASHILWVGTWGGGIGKLDLQGARIPLYKSESPFAFYDDGKGLVWIGGAAGLSRLDRSAGTLRTFKADPAETVAVHAIHADADGNLWLGTFGKALRKFDPRTEKFSFYLPNAEQSGHINGDIVFAIAEDRKETLWVGSWGGGLNKFDRDANWFTTYHPDPYDREALSSGYIYTIHPDSAEPNVLWLGTTGGLNRFDTKTEAFTHWKHEAGNEESLNHNNVLSIHEDKNGLLWLGTYGGGLNRFDKKSGKFKHYTVKNGLPQNFVFGILEDEDGNLWLSTNKGLAKFNPKTEIFTNFDVDDGLQGSEFNQGAFHKGPSGELYFGGVHGFNAFQPRDMKLDTHVPPVVITNFTINNVPAELGKPLDRLEMIELDYDQSIIFFEFAALSFAAPEKNRYQYRLVGLHDFYDVPAERRFATYTSLDPGTYTLEVRGSNRHHVWNETGVKVQLTVAPPPWRTWWAYGIYLAILGGMVFAYLRYQEQRIERIKKEQRLVTVEKDLDIASTVQTWFLPQSPRLQSDKLKLSGFYRPADRCSGDWWWYERLADGKFWVVVGDVTGHGAGPAVVTASVATALRVQRSITDNGALTTTDRLTHVNQEILSICGGKYYMTTSSIEVDEKRGTLRFYGTGGLPALCLRKEGKSQAVGARGTPLGVSTFEVGKVDYEMEPGERLMILTDGIAETQMPDGKALGMRRTREILEATRGMPLDAAAQAIVTAVDKFRAGTPQEDDFTFVLLDWNA